MHKFAPASADESIVFGSARPGYSDAQVNKWIEFMQRQGIQRVCCLLPQSQLARYSDLLSVYRQTFGEERVCWTPIEDFHFVEAKVLTDRILPFLMEADYPKGGTASHRIGEKVVVHCSGGIGRTGHVLSAWLVAGRGLSIREAIAAVKQTGRNPYEAVIAAPFKGRNPWRVAEELNELLKECHQFRDKLTSGGS